MKPHIAIHIIGAVLVMALAGCAAIDWPEINWAEAYAQLEKWADEWQGQQQPPPPPLPGTNAPAAPPAEPAAGFPAEITGPVVWLHTDVSGWPVTSGLNASIGGGQIRLNYEKARVWPVVDNVNANPWVLVKWTDGKWYAATFEWFKFGQTSKPVGVLDGSKGDHIKRPPLSGWRPKSGERFGVMVSGLARGGSRNVRERSTIEMVTWP